MMGEGQTQPLSNGDVDGSTHTITSILMEHSDNIGAYSVCTVHAVDQTQPACCFENIKYHILMCILFP